jgi:hypothetical protein
MPFLLIGADMNIYVIILVFVVLCIGLRDRIAAKLEEALAEGVWSVFVLILALLFFAYFCR